MLLLSICEDRMLTDCFKCNNTLPLVLHSFVPVLFFSAVIFVLLLSLLFHSLISTDAPTR